MEEFGRRFADASVDGVHLNCTTEWRSFVKRLLEDGLIRGDELDALQDMWAERAAQAHAFGREDRPVGMTLDDFVEGVRGLYARPHHAKMDAAVDRIHQETEALASLCKQWGIESLDEVATRQLLELLSALSEVQGSATDSVSSYAARQSALLTSHCALALFWEEVVRTGGPGVLERVIGAPPLPHESQRRLLPRIERRAQRLQVKGFLMRVSVLPLLEGYMTGLLKAGRLARMAQAETELGGSIPPEARDPPKPPRVDTRFGNLIPDVLGHTALPEDVPGARAGQVPREWLGDLDQDRLTRVGVGGVDDGRTEVRLFRVDLSAAEEEQRKAQEVSVREDPRSRTHGVSFIERQGSSGGAGSRGARGEEGRGGPSSPAPNPGAGGDAGEAASSEDSALEVVAIPRPLVGAHVQEALMRTYIAHCELIEAPHFADARGIDDTTVPGVTLLMYRHHDGTPLRDLLLRGGFLCESSPLFRFWAAELCAALRDLCRLSTHSLLTPLGTRNAVVCDSGSKIVLAHVPWGPAIATTDAEASRRFADRERMLVCAFADMVEDMLGVQMDAHGTVRRAAAAVGRACRQSPHVVQTWGVVVAPGTPLAPAGEGAGGDVTVRYGGHLYAEERVTLLLPPLAEAAREAGEGAELATLAASLSLDNSADVRVLGARTMGTEEARRMLGGDPAEWGVAEAAEALGMGASDQVTALTVVLRRAGEVRLRVPRAALASGGGVVRGVGGIGADGAVEGGEGGLAVLLRVEREVVSPRLRAILRVCRGRGGAGQNAEAGDAGAGAWQWENEVDQIRQASFEQLCNHPYLRSTGEAALGEEALAEFERRYSK